MGSVRWTSKVAVTTLIMLAASFVPAVLVANVAVALPRPIRIMPLGDSITLGAHDANPAGSQAGYRNRLENLLVGGGYSFDFVGTQTSGPASLNDKNHEGHAGFLINDVRANIFSYLATAPDVVLLMIGTNDMGYGVTTGSPPVNEAPTRLAGLIDTILNNSSAKIIVAQITPFRAPFAYVDPYVQNYNAAIPAIVNARSARVSMVNMHSAINPATDMDDENHPDQSGYDKIADRWYGALRPVLATIQPKIVPGSVTVSEGNSGTKVVQVPVTLSAPSNQTVTASWTTLNDSATAPSDYPGASGSVSFAPNQTSKTVSVTVKGDTAVEGNERFFVSFSNPTNATIGGVYGLGFVNINNDDAALSNDAEVPPSDEALLPKIVPGSVTVTEGGHGTKVIELAVTLSAPSNQTVTASWTTLEDSATSPSDFPGASGTISFAPNETSKTVSVTVNGDTVAEANERFFVSFSNPTNAAIGGVYGLGFVNVTNDD